MAAAETTAGKTQSRTVADLDAETRFNLRQALSAVSDHELRDGVIELFLRAHDAVANDGVKIVVLAARRMPCLYMLLLEAGLEPLGCEVVSDRFLQIDRRKGFWRGREARILDDSVIVGSTLTFLRQDVISLVGDAELVEVDAVCTDSDQIVGALAAEVDLVSTPTRTTAEVRQFSVDIATALFQSQIPYFSDFPISSRIALGSRDVDALLELDGWLSAEVTSALMGTPNHAAYSLLPNERTWQAIERALGPTVASCVAIAKVRLFTRFVDERGELVVVPLALVDPCSETRLNEALESIAEKLRRRGVNQLQWQRWSVQAKQRLLQMHASAVVMACLWLDAKDAVDALPVLDAQLLRDEVSVHHFGREKAADIEAAFDLVLAQAAEDLEAGGEDAEGHHVVDAAATCDKRLARPSFDDKLERVREELSLIGPLPAPGPRHLCRFGESFVQPVAAVFGFIDRHYETPERRQMKPMTAKKFHQKFKEPSDRWLNVGVTFPQLQGLPCVDPSSDTRWNDALVSFALDVCNDLGIAVPATLDRGGVVVRQYRIGENAFLSTRLIESAAEAIMGARARGSVASALALQDLWLMPSYQTVVASVRDVEILDPATDRALVSKPRHELLLAEVLAGPEPIVSA